MKLPIADFEEDVVAFYAAELTTAGMKASAHELTWGARVFFARLGGPGGWQAMSLDARLAQNIKVHRFVTWLAATQRIVLDPDYLVARRAHVGVVLARHWPAFHAAFVETARALGFSETAVKAQWAALGQAAAVLGLAPSGLTHANLERARLDLVAAGERHRGSRMRYLRAAMHGLRSTLFHLGVIDEVPGRRVPSREDIRLAEWALVPTGVATTMRRYLDQIAVSRRPGTVQRQEITYREFAVFLAANDPTVKSISGIERRHVEAYKSFLVTRQPSLRRHTIANRLGDLRSMFMRLIEWDDPDAPARVPIVAADLPIRDEPLPRFLDDPAAAKLIRAARAHSDPFVRICVELLARTGLRRGELLGLTVDAVVQIGSAYWLRVPVGKLHNDRYIPLHPQLKVLLDEWLASRHGARSDLIFLEKGRPISEGRVARAVAAAAEAAEIGHVTPHQLRHTLATQAINRGMSLEAIAALLGHRSLSMTMVYARIADRTVADEYFAVSEKVEALYGRPKALPENAEGKEMRKLRAEIGRRMLGNGWCARPIEMDCHFETVCESCSFFVTTVEFRPTIERQRDDAASKGQLGRQKLFDGLLDRLEAEAG